MFLGVSSAKPRLGLDLKIENGRIVSGYYQPNEEELKTVEYIMKAFLKYGTYASTLADLDKKGVLSKHGKKFRKDTLKSLLSDMRYLGEWIINEDNKDKDQEELMPYDRYTHIKDFPHGCVIDRKLFSDVQKLVRKIEKISSKKKNNVRRVNPLQGVLKYNDGTNFVAGGSVKEKKRYHYYQHEKIEKFIPVEVIEEDAKNILLEVINKSPRLQESLSLYGSKTKNYNALLEENIKKKHDEIQELENNKKNLQDKLFKLFETVAEEEVTELAQNTNKRIKEMDAQIAKLANEIEEISLKREGIDESIYWEEIQQTAQKAIGLIQAKNPVALKQIYSELFERIEVGDPDSQGVLPVKYVIRNWEEEDSLHSELLEPLQVSKVQNEVGMVPLSGRFSNCDIRILCLTS